MIHSAVSILFGPLAGLECRMASRRGWIIWIRLVAGVATLINVMVALWWWWINQKMSTYHLPSLELAIGLGACEGVLVSIALIMAPAVLAGSLAGDKERGSIGLLLTTNVSSLDIVLGRLAGRMSQIGQLLLAGVPGVLLLAWLSGFRVDEQITLLALPVAVALGGSGIALGFSAISRRGRDALLVVYLVDVLLLLSSQLALVTSPWVALINPYESIGSLSTGVSIGPAWVTIGVWLALGSLGVVMAAWRLRSASLATIDGGRKRARIRRRGWVPALDDRPMLWKELYIERAGSLGRGGRWLGALLVAWLGLGSLALAAILGWATFLRPDEAVASWAVTQLNTWYASGTGAIAALIVAAIGLRAAVTISSERERETWDALLTSPLEGSEIVRSKLFGSLYGLRWLIGSAFLAWTLAVTLGSMPALGYFALISGVAVVGAFLAAMGVRTSLRSATATRAMAATVGIGLGAFALGKLVAWIACISVAACCLFVWLGAVQFGLVDASSKPWFPMSFALGSDLIFFATFASWTGLVVAETRLRFDRVAGRMTDGEAAIAVDRFLHGLPGGVKIAPPLPKRELDEVVR